MKKCLLCLLLIGFCSLSAVLIAQSKSFTIKNVNGTDYYTYKVNAGESVFGIGRKFEVSIEDLYKANPGIEKGVKSGQELLIPIPKNTIEKTSDTSELVKPSQKEVISAKNAPDFSMHKVEKKQTIYAISNKYGISQDDMIAANPELKNGLREGMILRVPKQHTNTTPQKTIETTKNELIKPVVTENISKTIKPNKNEKIKNLIHQVQQGETLYAVSRKYNVKLDDLIRLNPGSTTTLSTGIELIIPAGGSLENMNPSITTKKTLDINVNRILNSKKNPSNSKLRIAFLLPFMLDSDTHDSSSDRFVDFYSGALLAIKTAKENGSSFEIYTYDTDKSEQKMVDVLQNSELKTMDLIVGPAYSNQVSYISNFAKENRINTLIPFTSKFDEIDSNPYLFQFNPGLDAELRFAIDLFCQKYNNTNLIFAELPGVTTNDENKRWTEGLQDELTRNKRSFTKLKLNSSENADFETSLKKGMKNIILFNSGKFTQVSPYLSALRSNKNDFDIVLFEQYHWKTQEVNMSTMLISPFQSSFSEKFGAFNDQYEQTFNRRPEIDQHPRYELLGYDLITYFIQTLERFGNKFGNKTNTFNFTDGLQSQPQFIKSSNQSGYINQKLYLDESN